MPNVQMSTDIGDLWSHGPIRLLHGKKKKGTVILPCKSINDPDPDSTFPSNLNVQWSMGDVPQTEVLYFLLPVKSKKSNRGVLASKQSV